MGQTLTISDQLFEQLAKLMAARGLDNIEDLLNSLLAIEAEQQRRREIVQQIDVLRESMAQRYGETVDSVDLLREDRG
jgi:hypothetical protein